MRAPRRSSWTLTEATRAVHAVVLSALVLLAFLAAARVLRHPLAFTDPLTALGAAVVALGLPVLPLSRTSWGRERICAASALLAAAGWGVLSLAPLPGPDAILAAALTAAASAVFLAHGVGFLPRRSIAAGAAFAVFLDSAAVAAGALGWRLPLLLPCAIIALAASALLAWLYWTPRAGEETAGDGYERRAAGLRLRGAVGFGAIVFLEEATLAAASAAAGKAALALVALGAAIWLLGGGGPTRFYRRRLLVMGGAAALAPAIAWRSTAPVQLFLLLGQLSALLLLGRALAPSNGRRGGWTIVAGIAVLLLFDVLLAQAVPAYRTGVFAAAGAVLAGSLVLVPRPQPAPPLLPRSVGWIALACSVGIAAVVVLVAGF